jgi:hypothetical protein
LANAANNAIDVKRQGVMEHLSFIQRAGNVPRLTGGTDVQSQANP